MNTNEQKPVDVLAVMAAASLSIGKMGDIGKSRATKIDEARAAIAELIETARRAEVSFNTVRGCYERNPGNFAVAMRELEADVIPLRAALARVGAA